METPVNTVANMETSNNTEAPVEIIPNVDPNISWEERKVQIITLCKHLWPSALDYACDDKQVTGGYNEVYFITITQSPGVSTDFVIRCPLETYWFGPLIDSVAILHHIRQTTPMRVPAVVAYDTTKDNALGSRYIILERCAGVSLREVLDEFTPEQRTVLAKEVGEVYTQLRAVRSPFSGRITASTATYLPSLRPEETLSRIPITIEPYGARMPEELVEQIPTSGVVGGLDEDFLSSGGMTSDPPNLGLGEMVTRALDRRLVQASCTNTRADYTIRQRVNLSVMIDSIVRGGHVEDSDSTEFCLWHSDLFPRNIMVDVGATPTITAVIDWDEAVYAPKFAAAVAPTWLWEPPEDKKSAGDEEQEEQGEGEDGVEDSEGDKGSDVEENVDDDDDGCSVSGPENDEETFEKSNANPPTPELCAVRRAWEDAVGPDCAASARSHHAILARRILRFALVWQWEDWYEDLYWETLDEWRGLGLDDGEEGESSDEEEVQDIHEDDSDGEEGESGDDEKVQGVHEDDDDEGWETCSDSKEDRDTKRTRKSRKAAYTHLFTVYTMSN